MRSDTSIPNAAPRVGRSKFRQFLKFSYHASRLLGNYAKFVYSKQTPARGFQSMRQIFTMSNGRWTSRLARWFGKPVQALPSVVKGVLGELNSSEIQKIADTLEKDGVYISPIQLSPEFCAALRDHCRSAKCHLVPAPANGEPIQNYDPNVPVAPRYDVEEAYLLKLPEGVELLTDRTFEAVTGRYLGYAPVNDMIWAWWTIPFNQGKASSAAAQYYHFDCDRMAFLKMFIYLTDCATENGPHWFVKGSHRSKPKELLIDDRVSDESIRKHYSDSDIIEITGKAGTLFIEDTRGFHKGSPVLSGERLALEVQLSDSLFGAPYTSHQVDDINSDVLEKAVKANRHGYQRFRV